LLNSYDEIDYKVLNTLGAEVNYGGRVTDDKDRLCMEHVLRIFYCDGVFSDDDYKFSRSGIYFAPKFTNYDGYIEYVKSLPNYPDPEVYGFHENAAITKNQNATNNALAAIMLTQQNAGGADGEGGDAMINRLADAILVELPPIFDIEAAEAQYPVSYEQSMNTVLTQELTRFNGLTKDIRQSLVDLKRAVKGEVLLSADLEAALLSLTDGAVPALWLKKSYPSLKPLGGYVKDLLERLAWFRTWVAEGLPSVMWISRFHFSQGFLTGAKQNYARKHRIAIDLLDYDFEVVEDEAHATSHPPDDGIYVTGPYLEGAKWNATSWHLDESDPKVLYAKAPMVWFRPCKVEEFKQHKTYSCPLYKTSARRGVLMTTGHSTNFVLKMRLPTVADESHWILRGVAMLCGLDD
jgi:dynein heavy chain